MSSEIVKPGSQELTTNLVYTPDAIGDFTADDAKKEKLKFGNKIFDLPYGDVLVRFLPYLKSWAKPDVFYCIFTHFVTVPGSTKVVPINCAKMMLGKRCPVCEEQFRLAENAQNSDADRQAAKRLTAKPQFMANVLVEGLIEAGPLLIRINKDLHQDLMDLRANAKKGGDFMITPSKTRPKGEGKFTIITKEKKSNGFDGFKAQMSQEDPWVLPDLNVIMQQTDIGRSQYAAIDDFKTAAARMRGEKPVEQGRVIESTERVGSMLNRKVDDEESPF